MLGVEVQNQHDPTLSSMESEVGHDCIVMAMGVQKQHYRVPFFMPCLVGQPHVVLEANVSSKCIKQGCVASGLRK